MMICPRCGRERPPGSWRCARLGCWDWTSSARLATHEPSTAERLARAAAEALTGFTAHGAVAFGWGVHARRFAAASTAFGFGDHIPLAASLRGGGPWSPVEGVVISAGGVAFRLRDAPAQRLPWSEIRGVHPVEDHLALETAGWYWRLPALRCPDPPALAAALRPLVPAELSAATPRDAVQQALARALTTLRAEHLSPEALREARRTLEQLRTRDLQPRPELTPIAAIDEARTWGDGEVIARATEPAYVHAHELHARVGLEGPAARPAVSAFTAALRARIARGGDDPVFRQRALERALAAAMPLMLDLPPAPDALACVSRFVEAHGDERAVGDLRRLTGRSPRRSELPSDRRRFLLCTAATSAWPTEVLRGAPRGELVKAGWSFPPGHPVEGAVYVAHPLDATRYVELAEFHRTLRKERCDELRRLLASLDAVEVELHDAEDEEPAPAVFARRPQGTLANPGAWCWLHTEPQWQTLAAEVRAGALVHTRFELAARGDFGVDAACKRRLRQEAAEFGVDITAQVERESDDDVEQLLAAAITLTASFPLPRKHLAAEERRAASQPELDYLRDCEELHRAHALDTDEGRRLLERTRERLGLHRNAATALHAAFTAYLALDPRERAFLHDVADLTERRDARAALERVINRLAARLEVPPDRARELRHRLSERQLRFPPPPEAPRVEPKPPASPDARPAVPIAAAHRP